MGYFSLLGLASLAPRIGVCCSMFLHVRIKTKGGERDTHKDNALKTTELLKHFHLPVKISSRMLLVSIYFLSDFRLNLEKTKGFSAPTPPRQK